MKNTYQFILVKTSDTIGLLSATEIDIRKMEKPQSHLPGLRRVITT
ncbi:MAG: hypothetical protein ACI92E_001178 [Oceanicoccus sp.]|jgi:hypothetical protein